MRVQQLRDRHLRSVPEREPNYEDVSKRVAELIAAHSYEVTVGEVEREVSHLAEEANRDGLEQAAACLENALAELRAAREGCK